MTQRKGPARPVAVVTAKSCSVCGLGWERHGEDPTLEKCVELLKEEVVAAAQRAAQRTWVQQGSGTSLHFPISGGSGL